jgi:hypothetical protein
LFDLPFLDGYWLSVLRSIDISNPAGHMNLTHTVSVEIDRLPVGAKNQQQQKYAT